MKDVGMKDLGMKDVGKSVEIRKPPCSKTGDDSNNMCSLLLR